MLSTVDPMNFQETSAHCLATIYVVCVECEGARSRECHKDKTARLCIKALVRSPHTSPYISTLNDLGSVHSAPILEMFNVPVSQGTWRFHMEFSKHLQFISIALWNSLCRWLKAFIPLVCVRVCVYCSCHGFILYLLCKANTRQSPSKRNDDAGVRGIRVCRQLTANETIV